MVAVGLLNSLIRIFGDPYLRWKLYQLLCIKSQVKYERRFLEFKDNSELLQTVEEIDMSH